MSSNSFGKLFTVTTFGESHGPAIGCVIDGCPPGLPISAEEFRTDLDRRATGRSRYTSQRHEADEVEILSGVYEGKTTGTPIALLIRNTDQRRQGLRRDRADAFRSRRHADYTSSWQKYGIRDPRGGGRSSARDNSPCAWLLPLLRGKEVAGRVAATAVRVRRLSEPGRSAISRRPRSTGKRWSRTRSSGRMRRRCLRWRPISMHCANPAIRSVPASTWWPTACLPGGASRSTANSMAISPVH